MGKTVTSDNTMTGFVRNCPMTMPVAEVVRKAKKAGRPISTDQVYKIRSRLRLEAAALERKQLAERFSKMGSPIPKPLMDAPREVKQEELYTQESETMDGQAAVANDDGMAIEARESEPAQARGAVQIVARGRKPFIRHLHGTPEAMARRKFVEARMNMRAEDVVAASAEQGLHMSSSAVYYHRKAIMDAREALEESNAATPEPVRKPRANGVEVAAKMVEDDKVMLFRRLILEMGMDKAQDEWDGFLKLLGHVSGPRPRR